MGHHATTDIDRQACRRTVPMKVLVLGLSRTGTDSIRKALMQLGYLDTYHGFEAATENPRDCEMWMQALRAKFDGTGKEFGRDEFDRLLGHCQAVCDFPAACFAKELIAAYPEAKVILSNRDVDGWHRSVSEAILPSFFTPTALLLSVVCWLSGSPNRWTRATFVRVFRDYFDGSFELHGKRVFHEHYAMVRGLVSQSNLLEYQVQDGWPALCDFLGCAVPTTPFPNGNTKEELDLRVNEVVNCELRRLSELAVLLLSMIVGFLVFASFLQSIVAPPRIENLAFAHIAMPPSLGR